MIDYAHSGSMKLRTTRKRKRNDCFVVYGPGNSDAFHLLVMLIR